MKRTINFQKSLLVNKYIRIFISEIELYVDCLLYAKEKFLVILLKPFLCKIRRNE